MKLVSIGIFAFFSLLLYLCSTASSLIEYKIDSGIIDAFLVVLTNFCFSHKRIIVVISIGVQTIIQLGGFYYNNKVKQKLISRVLKEIILVLFHNEISKTRITIMRKSSWIPALTRYVVYNLVFGFRRIVFSSSKLRIFWRNIPWKWDDYFLIYSRYGLPATNLKTAIFPVPEMEEEIDGYVGFAWLNPGIQKLDLPDISDVEITNIREIHDLPETERTKILDYMRKCKIKNFRRLQNLRRRSKYLWATQILDNDEELWGVLVLDHHGENNPFDSDFDNRMNIFTKLINNLVRR
ncbi:hypothetical protein EHQ76_09140 [Leptospira barantonii]|uniref:GAF domain-containing protein n=1 Tax=Leptospira barantonii TaxID=2023184 RepID=A0A5F2BDZ3_9LEPT|nr:hypothetical protein [Leptospira barantonii]TGM03796.1 hypothetical protein EHQ76_09140 [Leptospira barantonii]